MLNREGILSQCRCITSADIIPMYLLCFLGYSVIIRCSKGEGLFRCRDSVCDSGAGYIGRVLEFGEVRSRLEGLFFIKVVEWLYYRVWNIAIGVQNHVVAT